MGSFANLGASLNLNIQNFASGLRRASMLTSSFSSNLQAQLNDGIVRPAKEAKFEFKDVARIVQGIIISKVFYSGLNAIRNCISATWDFSSALEYAKIAYSNLFSDGALAEEFINVLKDFASVTPFSFKDSEAAAKRLLAYGVQYKNVMYMMQGIMAASSAQNNPQVIESVSRAIGQIYTKGRLMNEEMRQLAEAGIPAYAILREELGLTQEQLQNLGDESIAASTAINALIDGMNKRYGGVVNASSKTMQGILSNIKDNALMIGSNILEPLYLRIKSLANKFGEFIARVRDIYELRGIGGVFNELVPQKLQMQLRTLVANILNVWTVVKINLKHAFNIVKAAAYALMQVLNVLLPILTAVVDVFSRLSLYISKNEKAMRIFTQILAAAAAMWVVYKVRALSAAIVTTAINLMSKALAGLATTLTFIAYHPFWSALIIGIGIVTALSGAFDTLGQKIRNAFMELTRLNGYKPSDIFLESQNKRANDINKFNEALDGTADAMEDVGDATEAAAKKAKNAQKDLLSFDEVFRLKDPDEGVKGGIDTDDLIDIGDIGDISDIDTDTIMPDIPDFADYATDFVDNFVKALKDKFLSLKDRLISAGIGTLIGAALGGILGGPLGAKVGAIAGTIIGWFWDDIRKAIGLTDTSDIAIPIGTALGLAIGKLVGHPIIGGAIGTLIGWLVSSIIDAIQTGDWSDVGLPIGTSLGLAIGALVGHPIIGTAIGALVGWIYNSIADSIKTGDWSSSCMPIGTGLGLAIGALVGHPIIGAAIGTLVGWLVGKLWNTLKDKFGVADVQGVATALNTAFSTLLTSVASFISTRLIPVFLNDSFAGFATNCSVSIKQALTTGLKGGILAGIASLGAGLLTNALTGWIAQELNMSESDLKNSGIGQSVGGLVGSIAGLIISGGSPIGATIGNMIGQLVGGVLGLFWEDIVEWCSKAFEYIKQWCSDTVESVGSFISNIGPNLQSLFGEIGEFISNIPYNLGYALGEAAGHVANFILMCSDAIAEFFTVTIPEFISTAVDTISNFFTVTLPELFNNFMELLDRVGQTINNFFTVTLPELFNKFVDFISNLGKVLREFFTVTLPNILQTAAIAVGNFFTVTIPNAINTAVSAICTFFTETLPEAFEVFLQSLANIGPAIVTFFTVTLPEAFASIQEFFSGLWDTFVSWGANVVNGFIQGFRDAFGVVWEAIVEFFQGFMQGFQDTFGIHSPAESMIPIGQYILLGLLEGMYLILEDVMLAISEIGLQIIEEITRWFTEIGMSISTWATETATTISTWYTSTSTTISNWVSEKISEFSTWASSTRSSIVNWASSTLSTIAGWVSNTTGRITSWASTILNQVSNTMSSAGQRISSFVTDAISRFSTFVSTTISSIHAWASNMVSSAASAMNNFVSNVASGLNNALSNVANFCASALAKIQAWAASFGAWVSNTISNAWAAVNSFVSSVGSHISGAVHSFTGHATGGVFNKEHIARFAEGNKAEAIIPLENRTAMQPFVDAVADGLAQSFGPILANMSGASTSNTNQLPPLYVGTLIADERGLKELNRRMQVIQLKENMRRG